MNAIHRIFLGRRLCCTAGRMLMPVLLGMLSLVLTPANTRGGALSFVSNPADAQLDGDAIRDIEVAPGDRVEYFITLNTFGLAGAGLAPVVNFSYKVIFDPTELQHVGLIVTGTRLDILDDPATLPGGLFPGGDSLVVVGGTAAVTHLGGNVAANTVRPLDLFVFTVLAPVNDGLPDFAFSEVLINGVAAPAGVFTFDQDNEVQPRPVPEPATLLLVGSSIVILLGVLRLARWRRNGPR